MKRYSILLFIRKMKSKTIMTYTHSPEWLKLKTLNTTYWHKCRGMRALIHWWWEGKLALPLWKNIWQQGLKLNYSYLMNKQA